MFRCGRLGLALIGASVLSAAAGCVHHGGARASYYGYDSCGSYHGSAYYSSGDAAAGIVYGVFLVFYVIADACS
ncbi:MAG: hypothetical protein AAFR96_09460 [Planctomycetota bacterium]